MFTSITQLFGDCWKSPTLRERELETVPEASGINRPLLEGEDSSTLERISNPTVGSIESASLSSIWAPFQRCFLFGSYRRGSSHSSYRPSEGEYSQQSESEEKGIQAILPQVRDPWYSHQSGSHLEQGELFSRGSISVVSETSETSKRSRLSGSIDEKSVADLNNLSFQSGKSHPLKYQLPSKEDHHTKNETDFSREINNLLEGYRSILNSLDSSSTHYQEKRAKILKDLSLLNFSLKSNKGKIIDRPIFDQELREMYQEIENCSQLLIQKKEPLSNKFLLSAEEKTQVIQKRWLLWEGMTYTQVLSAISLYRNYLSSLEKESVFCLNQKEYSEVPSKSLWPLYQKLLAERPIVEKISALLETFQQEFSFLDFQTRYQQEIAIGGDFASFLRAGEFTWKAFYYCYQAVLSLVKALSVEEYHKVYLLRAFLQETYGTYALSYRDYQLQGKESPMLAHLNSSNIEKIETLVERALAILPPSPLDSAKATLREECYNNILRAYHVAITAHYMGKYRALFGEEIAKGLEKRWKILQELAQMENPEEAPHPPEISSLLKEMKEKRSYYYQRAFEISQKSQYDCFDRAQLIPQALEAARSLEISERYQIELEKIQSQQQEGSLGKFKGSENSNISSSSSRDALGYLKRVIQNYQAAAKAYEEGDFEKAKKLREAANEVEKAHLIQLQLIQQKSFEPVWGSSLEKTMEFSLSQQTMSRHSELERSLLFESIGSHSKSHQGRCSVS